MPEQIAATQNALLDRLSARDVSNVLSNAIASGITGSADDAAIFYSLSQLDATLHALSVAFPSTALHAVAVKANPVVEILKRIRKAGHGAEVASIGELELAVSAGFAADTIIFDSPVKAQSDLELALKKGVWINANTLEELALIVKLRPLLKSSSRGGVRINPETGVGKIRATSVMKMSSVRRVNVD